MVVDNFIFKLEEKVKDCYFKNFLKTQDYPLKIGLQDKKDVIFSLIYYISKHEFT